VTGEANNQEDMVSRRTMFLGMAGAVAGCAVVGFVLLAWTYGMGRAKGAAQERQRLLSREQAVRIEDVPLARQQPLEHGDEPAVEGDAADGAAVDERDLWCFGPMEAARVVWPMEIARPDPQRAATPLRFRLRQGANRFAPPGKGLCEFVFSVPRNGMVNVFVKSRFKDDCANTLECLIDGKRSVWIVGRKVYGTWFWEQAPRSFMLKKGLHRLTIGTCEDGLEFERVVVAQMRPDRLFLARDGLETIAITQAPTFESFPASSAHLPRIEGVTAGVFSTHSLVVGRGHVNALGAYLRLNRAGSFDGTITVEAGAALPLQSRRIHLDEKSRSALMRFDLHLGTSRSYYVPVRVVLRDDREVLARQRINFIAPLSWAFLGPFPDPQRKGLDLATPADARIGQLHELPELGDVSWRIYDDGSCYDDFGLVDLNKVFGFANKCWVDVPDKMEPMVAFAVTFVGAGTAHHAPVAFGGDDCMQVWVDGRPLLRHDGNVPIETCREVVGVSFGQGVPSPLPPGRMHPIVFKVPQTGYYWHLLLEPDEAFPYGRPARFGTVPVLMWSRRK